MHGLNIQLRHAMCRKSFSLLALARFSFGGAIIYPSCAETSLPFGLPLSKRNTLTMKRACAFKRSVFEQTELAHNVDSIHTNVIVFKIHARDTEMH